MELSDEIKSELSQKIEGTPVSQERAEEIYAEKADKIRQQGGGDGDVAKYVMPLVQSEFNQFASAPSDTEQLEALVIGHSGYRGWNDNDFSDTSIAAKYGVDSGKMPVLVANAILEPENADPALGALIFRASDHDSAPSDTTLEDIRSTLTPMSTYRGEFNFEVSNDVHDFDFFIGNSTNTTQLEAVDTDASLDDRRARIDEYVREIEVASVAQEVHSGDRYGFAGALGADMARVEGVIADYYLSDDGDIGTYVLQDNSMPDFRELDEEVQGDGRTPGLTCWMQTEQMNYDTDSIVSVYGNVSQSNKTGQISLNSVGIAPIFAEETTLSPSSQSSQQRDTQQSGQVSETMI